MKRCLIAILLIALPAAAGQEKWWDAYNRGVKAVNAKNYAEGIAALQKALEETPAENAAARPKNETFAYVPHYWLGIARFNLGDFDGALREWKTSEEQGAVEKTDYYSKLRDWMARAQAEKQRGAQSAAAASKSAADAALRRALASQMEALSSGGDRTDSYRAANRKLQEALSLFNSGGTDIKAYERVAATAGDAKDLFGRAAEEGKKMKAARPAIVARQQPAQVKANVPAPVQQTQTASVAQAPAAEAAAATQTASTTQTAVVAAPAVLTPKEEPVLVATVTTAPSAIAAAAPLKHAPARAQLESAYRAFATGDLNSSERALTSMLDASPSGEAFLLRGCARYTLAMLTRNSDSLLAAARSDFKAALKLNRSLRLDKTAFSPKLIAFFEEVRRGG
jgi:tetratricopeptide (TPR) repeat protein